MDPNRYPEDQDSLLTDLYEVSFPPRDEEMYNDVLNWVEWNGYL
ncbi:MAG: hypothetical protein ACM32O_00755 [Clostridia bacterium]